ncbi:MAG: bifunctional riboflavin kinase/FAD synthetase [Isosphaera sp.]|nr:bifunctional riboflavin kinase/FAD synthetase [Isosphaera sp.]
MSERSVLTIGTFDGVHLGHAELLRAARRIADERAARVVALVFDPSPAEALRPGAAPPRLTTLAQRRRAMSALGVDEVVPLDPGPRVLTTPAEGFIAELVARYAPLAMVEGPDFRFGLRRAGDVALLRALGAAHGFAVRVPEQREAGLLDGTVVPARSSVARWLISHGRVGDAALVLGRAHELEGVVAPGQRLGRALGVPTANLATPCMSPGDGVYAGTAHLPPIEPGGPERAVPAAVNVGARPTVGGAARTIEAHLMMEPPGAAGSAQGPGRAWSPLPGLPEYGWPLRLELLSRLRDQVRFDGLGALRAQIARDLRQAWQIAAEPARA